jgi:phosphopantothenoylcysteine decarboxylase / phosphopantothenate---cysteine ligase
VHPVENIRGTASRHLAGRTIVLGVCGSIAAVKAVELARELIRHGADVVPVMTESATRILHPDALEFATGRKPIVRLTGATEHIALLGDVKGKADLLLVAPATANTVSKMALGIDDSPVTTCATVAFGTGTPVVVAPAMHEAMMRHPIVARHKATLVHELGVTWIEPLLEERKAKLADEQAVAEQVIHRLARGKGALSGKRVLVVNGATVEPLDPVRVITNRSSGRMGHLLAQQAFRLGAEVTLWDGAVTDPQPAGIAAVRFASVADLLGLVAGSPDSFDQVWMPAAIGDFGTKPAEHKLPSDDGGIRLELSPLPKVVKQARAKWPRATLVAFKAESDHRRLLPRARARLKQYGADWVVANTVDAFGAADATVHLVSARGTKRMAGSKEQVAARLLAAVAAGPGKPAARAAGKAAP